jgi:hypothetical protein
MKKLFAGLCCILFLRNFSRASVDQATGSEKAAGQKMLIKAITAMVNTEGNKKAPAKTIHVFSSDCP